MNQPENYTQLLKDYSDLQLRVTKFSSVEQQLINTRDLLDRELLSYKKLIDYNSKVFKEITDKDFFLESVEAIIDIFESDVSLIVFDESSHPNDMVIYAEGMHAVEIDRISLLGDLFQILGNYPASRGNLLSGEYLAELACMNKFSSGVLYYFTDVEMGYRCYLFSLVTKRNAPFYKNMEERNETVFTIFGQLVESIFISRKKSEQIKKQLTEIGKSHTELRKLSLIATKTKNSVVIADADGKVEWVNQAFTDVTNYTVEDIKDNTLGQLLAGVETEKEKLHLLNDAIGHHRNIETVIKNYRKNGELFYNQVEIIPVFDTGNQLVNYISIQKDITNDFLHKTEILRINSRYEIITQKSKIGIWEFDCVTNEHSWNDIIINQYGGRRREIERDYTAFWEAAVYHDDLEHVLKTNAKILSGELDFAELQYRIVRHDTKQIRTLECLTISERDRSGRVLRLVGSSIDITEAKDYQETLLAKNNELKKINHELDRFVYSISHDLRSPLLSIQGLLAIILDEEVLSETITNYLKLIDRSILRLDDTIHEILSYSRNSRLEVVSEKFDIVEMVKATFEDIRYSIPDKMNLGIEVVGDTVIYSDKVRLSTLIKNIIGNSVKYKKLRTDDSYVKFSLVNKEEEILLKFEDNGIGMSEKTLSKMFDMFYRGTNQSTGTGLGLYICKEIINKLNGKIEVKSELKVGTVISIILNKTSEL